jgi:hypothetical protein
MSITRGSQNSFLGCLIFSGDKNVGVSFLSAYEHEFVQMIFSNDEHICSIPIINRPLYKFYKTILILFFLIMHYFYK